MTDKRAIQAMAIPEHKAKSLYPEPFAFPGQAPHPAQAGDHFGLANFGVNPDDPGTGAISALKHHHGLQDEFVYVLSGNPTLRHGEEEYRMSPGSASASRGQRPGPPVAQPR